MLYLCNLSASFKHHRSLIALFFLIAPSDEHGTSAKTLSTPFKI